MNTDGKQFLHEARTKKYFMVLVSQMICSKKQSYFISRVFVKDFTSCYKFTMLKFCLKQNANYMYFSFLSLRENNFEICQVLPTQSQ